MESSSGHAPLLGAFSIVRSSNPSIDTTRREFVALSDIELYNKSTSWPEDYEDLPSNREHFEWALRLLTNSPYAPDRVRARVLEDMYKSSGLRALSLRFEKELEHSKYGDLAPHLAAWIQVKRLADEGRMITSNTAPSQHGSSEQTEPSLPKATSHISQAEQGRAQTSTPLGSASTNKVVARRPPRPPYHSKPREREAGGVEVARGNGDNNHLYGAPIHEQTPNRDAGSLEEPYKRRKRTPNSNKVNIITPFKGSKSAGRLSQYALQNELDNQLFLGRGRTLNKEALAAGLPDPEQRARHFQSYLSHSRSKGIQPSRSREESEARNQICASFPQQQIPPPMQPFPMQPSPMQSSPMQNVAPSMGYTQMYPEQRGYYSPSPQMPMMFGPAPPSPSAAFYPGTPNQFLQLGPYGPQFPVPEYGLHGIHNPMAAQGQAQQPILPPPNEYVPQMFGDGFNSGFSNAPQPNHSLQNAYMPGDMQNQGWVQGQPVYNGYGHAHPGLPNGH